MTERKIDPAVLAAMDAAMSPACRELLISILRWDRLAEDHHALYQSVVHGAASSLGGAHRAAASEGRPAPICGEQHAIYEVFAAAAEGTPSEIEVSK